MADDSSNAALSPWLTVTEAAARARVSKERIYREVKAGRLRAAHVGDRRQLRFLSDWIDDWLISLSKPVDVLPWTRRNQSA